MPAITPHTTQTINLLKKLLSEPGLSAYEDPVRQMIEAAWQPLTDEISISRLGSLHGLRRAARPPSEGKPPSLLLAAHMDAIGLMVTGVVDGFLTLTEVGGLDQRILPGQRVIVHPADPRSSRQDLPGIIVRPPEYLLPGQARGKSTPIEYLLVDTGLTPSQVEEQIQVGDLVSFAQPPIEFGEDYLAGHTLDNRVSVAALTFCLEELQNRSLAWDVWAVATTQEEETMAGAFTSAFQLRPSLAVAIDVTFGDGAGSSGHKTFPIGKGITLGWGPNIHPALHKTFAGLADRLEIPWKLEPVPRMSGTDAYGLQVAAEGIPTMVIGIPLRYMHTPVEMASIKDILRTGRLLAEFAASLDQNTMDRIVWDA